MAIFASSLKEPLPTTTEPTFATCESVQPVYTCITERTEIANLLKEIAKQPYFCLDTETTSLSPYKATLLGISLSYEPKKAFFIPIPTLEKDAKKVLKLFESIFSNEKILKVGQNLKYDLLVLKQHGVEVHGPFFDTMVAHHLLEPNRRHNLTALANTYLHYAPIEIETLIGKKGKSQKSLRDVPLEALVTYACEDADITLQIFQKLAPLLKEEKLETLFYKLEMPLLFVLVQMEDRGIAIDTDMLQKISQELHGALKKIETTIYELAGVVFNIASPKQLGEVLFDRLKISQKPSKTPKGQYATNEPILLKYAKKNPIVQEILTYREIKSYNLLMWTLCQLFWRKMDDCILLSSKRLFQLVG